MFFDDVVVRVNNVSKRYELYDKPSDQLKQYLLPRFQRFFGLDPQTHFREFWALSDVSFEVKKGESFGIVGRNGSGKSTLLQIITGTLMPTTGSVATNGRVAALLELGSGFSPDFTGRENVFMNGALLGFSHHEMEQRFDAIAAFADIGEFMDQPVKSYSSGMTVRLAIAVQTQVEPDILIVDEALAVGDALFQKKCYRQIEKLLDNGCALLFVSHDEEIVRSLTSRAIFLNSGVVQQYGNSADVIFAYRKFLQCSDEQAFKSIQDESPPTVETMINASEYGNYDVQIVNVKISSEDGVTRRLFQVGEKITITISCVCHKDIENLNVAFRIRNKEGVKITTWGTLNEDMPNFIEAPEATFWSRSFTKNQQFSVSFKGVCSLSENLYEVQAIVAQEYDRYYGNQRILHWVDASAHFSVALISKHYVFDGVCDMGLRSSSSRDELGVQALTAVAP